MTPAGWSGNPAGVDDQDIIDLLELQRLTRELLDQPGRDGIKDCNAYDVPAPFTDE